MRRIVVSIVIALGIVFVACTASVSLFRPSVDSRVAESCDELTTLCQTAGNGCAELIVFCGPAKAELAHLFATEDSCKSSCSDDIVCIKSCKLERQQQVATVVSTYDFDGDGVVGDGASACSNLSNLCTSTGEACPATEFFCVAAAPAPSACSSQLEECKANCAPHDRACRGACRKAYRDCINGPTPDAGVPDAPTAPTTFNLTYGITASSTGSGSIALNPMGTSCGANCATYAANAMVTLTATPATGATFSGWVGCTSTTNTCTVTMTKSLTVTATFATATATTYNLTYGTTSGSTGTGTISLNPAGTSCGTNCSTYAASTSVTLTAKPATGSTFGGWTGCTSTTARCAIAMTAAKTVTARFTAAPAYTYTKDIAPKMTGLCNGCHGDASAPAGYRTDSYAGLFGNGSDNTPNIIAGDANSLFVTKIAGNHKNVLGQYPGFDTVVHDWVVFSNAAQ